MQTDPDLSTYRSVVSGGLIRDAAPALKSDSRDYVRQVGYIRGDELLPLGDTSLVVHEFLHVVDAIARLNRPTDDEQLYVTSLFQRAGEGKRFAPDPVSDSIIGARGLTYAEITDAYCHDLSTWFDNNPSPGVRMMLETLSNHRRRVGALDEVISPSESGAFVGAACEIYATLINNNPDVLAPARDTPATLF